MNDCIRMRNLLVVLLLPTLVLLSKTKAADWPQFRGLNSSGIAVGPAPPLEFGSGINELWRLPLASGHSSPCIVGDSIFLTTYDQEQKRLAVVCVDARKGAIRWRRTVTAEEIETGHPSFNPASSTPASDGEHVVAYFGSCGLHCFDMQGTPVWDLPLPLAKSYAGNATSPIIVEDRVILYRGNYTDHFVMAVDKRTGREIWRTPQSAPFTVSMACASTPVVARDKLILHSVNAVQAFDISSGQLIWQADAATTATSTPVLADREVIVATWNQTGEPALVPDHPTYEQLVTANDKDGDRLISVDELPHMMIFHRSEGAEAPENGLPLRFAWVDLNKDSKIDANEWSDWLTKSAEQRAQYAHHGMVAINLDSQGRLDSAQIRNLESQGIPEVPSPLYHDGKIYFVKNGGILTCLDLETGERVYRMRIGGRGTYYASPIIADGKLFATSGDGQISVVRLGSQPEILATNEIGERIYATPAIVDGVIYVRTHQTLFAFGSQNQ